MVVFGLFLAGNDDGKISTETCCECLLEAWDSHKTNEKQQDSNDLTKHEVRLYHNFAAGEAVLSDKLRESGLKIVGKDVCEEDVEVLAVGSIRTMRRGGDRSNIALFKKLPLLQSLAHKKFGDVVCAIGDANSLVFPPGQTKLNAVVFVVAPCMNQQRADCLTNEAECRRLLSLAYRNMFARFQEYLSSQTGSSKAAESNPLENPKRAKLTAEDKKPKKVLSGDQILPIGFGTLPLGVCYPDKKARPSPEVVEQMVVYIAQNAEEPVLIDMADTYCEGPSDYHYIERVIGKILQSRDSSFREKFLLATKCGMSRVHSESTGWRVRFDVSPSYVRQTLKASLAALNVKSVYLWQLHHADHMFKKNKTQLSNVLDEAVKMREEGMLKHIGLCNVDRPILLAYMLSITFVQNEFNFWCRDPETKGLFEICRSANITFIGHSPFGGLKARRRERSFETVFPAVKSVANRHGCSSAQVYLQYLVARGAKYGVRVILIPSGRSLSHVTEVHSNKTIEFTDQDMDELDAGWEGKSQQKRS